ncbi:MAG: TonB-dependent receptor plug domain-containing protein [Bacteroidetes bacterium]|nr:TonB-dependent receptor plug domain-containing protein [Bacteroidota bacterium]
MNRLVIHIILVFLLWNNSMAQSDTAIVKTTIDSIFNNKNILSECVIAVERYRPFDNINARNQDFNKFLQEKLPLQIKSYGSWGSVTTLSVRGTSDDQSGVIWNGVPIHSPTVGTTDLSLIPFEAVGKINFVLDYQADNLNSSSFGGMLNLTTNENVFDEFLDSNFIFKINSGFGSNGFYTQSGNIIFQNKNIISKSTVFYQFAKNDFKYSDVYKENAPKELALHNKMKNIGFMQDLNFTIPRGNIKLAAWFQQKNKELPSLMGSYDSSNKNQKDEVLRISNVYNLRLKKNELVLTGAFLQDKLRYTDKILPEDSVYFINSIIESKQFFQSAFFTLNPKSIRWNFTFGQLLNFQQANVNSYSSVPKEFNGALSSNLKLKFN